MSKTFNITGTCFPEKHYMVNISDKLAQIIPMVDAGQYFCINRARQYGKSTTLHALASQLSDKYIVFPLSFQRMSTAKFKDEDTFCRAFVERLRRTVEPDFPSGFNRKFMESLIFRAENYQRSFDLTDMFDYLTDLCANSDRPIVLIIDEVDNACNNQIFLDFLGQLRDLYLNRTITVTFQSVILAGVYDIKNLKQKIRPDDIHRYNSPWNIAADFNVDMHFSPAEIESMLIEYQNEHHREMDISYISQFLYSYTSGYPYMVSRLCKLMDEKIAPSSPWNKEGLLKAVRIFLKEPNSLFDDMSKKIDDNPDLKKQISNILFKGTSYTFEINNPIISIGVMFGFMKEQDNQVAIANRLFEIKLYNLLLSEEENQLETSADSLEQRNQFIHQGMLQMDIVMTKFYEYFEEICQTSSDKFIEDEGRRIFLMYLRPIINGIGNYYIESQTRDRTRTDVIVDYHGKQFIIELKLWHGQSYNERGKEQLFQYLDYYKQPKGYLLSFNFNKNKTAGIHEIEYKGKRIMEVVV